MAEHDTAFVCSCCALGVHYKFVVLSAPTTPLAKYARRLTAAEQAIIFSQLRRVHRHS
jgi:hypothetical protein